MRSRARTIPVPHARAKRVHRAAALGGFRRKQAGHVQRYRVGQDLVLEPRVPA